MSTLTHVSGDVKERQTLRFQGLGLHQIGGKAFVALLTKHRPLPLELGELQQVTMPPCGRLRLLSVAGGAQGDHQAIEINTIAQRRLLNGMLFIYGTGAAAAKVESGQDVADMGINRDSLSDLHGGCKERATRLAAAADCGALVVPSAQCLPAHSAEPVPDRDGVAHRAARRRKNRCLKKVIVEMPKATPAISTISTVIMASLQDRSSLYSPIIPTKSPLVKTGYVAGVVSAAKPSRFPSGRDR